MLQLKRVPPKLGWRTTLSQRHSRLFLVLLALCLAILLPSLTNAATIIKSDGTDGAVDGGSLTRTVEYTTSDFSGTAVISKVTASIEIEKIDGDFASACFTTGYNSGSPFNREIYAVLSSPGGTDVLLIDGTGTADGSASPLTYTYNSNSVYGGQVVITFDDDAAAQVGGSAPTAGSFRPEESLAAFVGEDPLGDWTLTLGDSATGAPLCLYDFSLTVEAEQGPTVDDQSFNVDEDSLNGISVGTILATDPDVGDKLNYTVTGGTGTAVFDVDVLTGEITVADETQLTDPGSGTPSSFTLNVTVTDSAALSDTAVITINIINVNAPPIITQGAGPIPVVMDEDSSPTPFSLTLDATDEEGDTLTWSISFSASNGTASASGTGNTKSIGYTPNPNYNGPDSFVVQVSDGNGGTDTITVNVTINPINDNPTAVDDSFTVDEDSSNNSLAVLDNDTIAPDTGETLTITAVGTTNNGGTATNNTTNIIYTPAANFFGTESFTYTISDGNGGSDTATVTVTVTGLPDDPIAVNDTFSVDENSTGNELDVLENDSDPDGDTLTITAVGPTDNGGTVTNNTTDLSYSPQAAFVGTEVFTYTVGDGTGRFSTATVTIEVEDVNDPPEITEVSPQEVTMDEDSDPVSFSLTLNATDLDGDTLTWSISSLASHGTASASGTGNAKEIGYIPTLNYYGSDSFVVQVSDGRGGVDTLTVNVTIRPINDAPTAVDDDFSVDEQSSNNLLYPLLNDTDPEDDYLTITAVGTPDQGGTAINNGRDITYTPLPTFMATEVFTYTISDGEGGSDTGTIRVSVDDVNFPPMITQGAAITVTMDEDGSPLPFSLTLNATDPDGDTLTWSIHSPATHGTAAVSGSGNARPVSYTPTADYFGTDSFMVRVSDGLGGMDIVTVHLIIRPINDPPTAVNDSVTTPPESPVIIHVLANDTDPEGDSLTITAVTQGSKGNVSHNGTTVTYTPNANESGDDSFTYTISDGNGGSDTGTVAVRLGLYEIFVPLILNNYVSAPDLVVTNVHASSALIEVVIENQGTQATSSGFWVDFYINPNPAPTHENQLWFDVADEGIVWGVDVSIQPGESLTLRYSTAPGAPNLYYSAINSSYGGSLPVGTSVYAQVDSAHLSTTFGGILEIHEILGEPYNNVSGPYTAVATIPTTTTATTAIGLNQISVQPLNLPLRQEPN